MQSCHLFTCRSPQVFFIRFLESKTFVTRFAKESNVSIFDSRFLMFHFLFFDIFNNSFSGLFWFFYFIFLIDNLVWTVLRMLLIRLYLNLLWIAIIWVFRLNLFRLIVKNIFHANTFGYNYVRFCLLVLLLLLLLFPFSPWHVFVMFLLSHHTLFCFCFLFWDSCISEYVQLRLIYLNSYSRKWGLIFFSFYFKLGLDRHN